MSDSYRGALRVMDPNGFLLDIGASDLRATNPDRRTWKGRLTVSKGSCLDRKSLTALVETTDGARALAQITPDSRTEQDRFVTLTVEGLGKAPF